MYISIDPGKNVGVATFKEDGTLNSKAVMQLENNFQMFLHLTYSQHMQTQEPLHFIMEEFKLRNDKALEQTGSDMPASRCIGAVEQIAYMLGAKIHWIPPGQIRTSLKWAGYKEFANKPRTWHCPDDVVAHAHGVFQLIQLKIIKHPLFT